MPKLSLLVIDDEPQIRRALRHALASDNVQLLDAATGAEGLALAASSQPDLVILDLGLPDVPGLAVCRDLRAFTAAPVLVLSARHSEQEKAALLDAGADDYVTKPFSTVELQARVRALLRRGAQAASPGGDGTLTAGDVRIDFGSRTVRLRGGEVHLTPTEWELLRTLASHAGRTLTHRQLYDTVWAGRPFGDAQRYLRVHIANLRGKLESDPVRPRLIRTEPGVGYRLVTD